MKKNKSKAQKIEVRKDEIAYVVLTKFQNRKVFKTIRLSSLIEDYKGDNVMLDFSEEGILMGIEILA